MRHEENAKAGEMVISEFDVGLVSQGMEATLGLGLQGCRPGTFSLQSL